MKKRKKGAAAMYFDGQFPPYVPVWKRRQQAAKKLKQLQKGGRKVSPIVIEGRKIVESFWGQAWCDNLEGYAEYSSRLPRGRTYVRNGSVIDLQIAAGKVTALVSGSEIYTVQVNINPLETKRWKLLVKECAGGIDSLVELLGGRFSDGVMRILCRQGKGLFPSTREISLSCSCPDGAWLCKHLAAVLYGVGARLDREPGLLFVLRGTDPADLIGQAAQKGSPLKGKVKTRTLKGESLADVFGIELEGAAEKVAVPRRRRSVAKRTRLSPRSSRKVSR